MTRWCFFIVFAVVFLLGWLPGTAPVTGAEKGAQLGSALQGQNFALPDIRDVKVLAAPRLAPPLLFVGMALVFLAGGKLAYGLWRNKQKKTLFLSPHDIAFSALASLQQKSFLSGGAVSHPFSEIAGIVRNYIESIEGLRAPAMTTEELLVAVAEEKNLSSSLGNLLYNVLTCCDRVKFAGYAPSAEEQTAMFASAREIIELIREAPHAIP